MHSANYTPPVPHDLLREIFGLLESDKASLCVISLVSGTFREEAQRILYRNVTPKTYTSHLKFLSAVSSSPTRLALFVRAYGQDWSSYTPPIEEFVKILATVVGDGLKAMHYLKELSVLVPSRSYTHHVRTAYTQILSACTFGLERFTWMAGELNADQLIDKFLPQQPALRHLGLTCYRSLKDPLRLAPSTMCPHLTSVTAHWPMIKAFLPGRRISTLRINYDSIKTAEVDVKPLAMELKGVKALSIPFCLLRETATDYGILRYFPSLIALEIYGFDYYYDDDNEEISTSLEMHDLFSILSKLPQLQTLILGVRSVKPDLQRDLKLARHIFANFGQHLRYIDMQSPKSYTRYTQSQEIAQEISEKEVRKLWQTSTFF